MEATVLDPERVSAIFEECSGGVDLQVDFLDKPIWFDRERIESHKDEIIAMLDELPDEFKETGGGGWSFLQACKDKHGNLWTGLHMVMGQLFALGMAIGKVEYLLPSKMWPVLPDGMPYLKIKM